MNKSTVVAYLMKNQDPRGIEHWKKRNKGALKSFGIGLTILRKYAKSIGRDAKLAKSLWNSNIHEMKIISILIDDPNTMTVEQAEAQVEELEGGYLAHVFSSCDAPLGKNTVRGRTRRQMDQEQRRHSPPLRVWTSLRDLQKQEEKRAGRSVLSGACRRHRQETQEGVDPDPNVDGRRADGHWNADEESSIRRR